MWACTQGGDWVVANWHLTIGCPSGDSTRVGHGQWWCINSHTTGTSTLSFWVAWAIHTIWPWFQGRRCPLGHVWGCGCWTRCAHHLTHYRDGDNDPIIVLHGRGCLCLWVHRLMPILRRWACGWMCSESCYNCTQSTSNTYKCFV